MRVLETLSLPQARLSVVAFCTASLLVIEGCGSEELQAPGHSPGTSPATAEMAVAPTNGLVGEWKLDETSGTTAADTKNGYDATVLGGAGFVAGRLGNALNLNNGTAGTGGKYAEMPSNATLDNVQEGDYTISAWFYAYSVPQDSVPANHIYAIVVKAGWHMGLVYLYNQTFSMRHYLTGNTLTTASSTTTYPINGWHHLAGVVNKAAGTVMLYVDGAVAGSGTFTAGTAAREYNATRFRIGKGSSDWAADGKVDQVRIYNRALSAAEVADLYNETTGAAPSATTNPASAIGTTTATLNGSANPNGSSTNGWFRYSTTNPGTCNNTFGTATATTALGSGSSAVAYSKGVAGLTAGQIYYFCAIASNTTGTSFGAVRYFVPVRFAVGMFDQQMADLGSSANPNAPDGKISWPGGNVPQILADAKAAGARIVLQVTSGNEVLKNSDGTFNKTKWKTDFDLVRGYADAIRPYVKDGTLIGHYAIDEPFYDFTNFQASDLEDICQYQKQYWPFVPCLVRMSNIELESVRPAGGYRYVDAGWAQLEDNQFEPAPYNNNVQAWFDSNLVKGQRIGLGLMYGYNLLDGGHEFAGCAQPNSTANCAMTSNEIRTMADALANLGHDQGCGVMGWVVYKTAGSQRDYYFGTGAYSGNGVQSALQYLWSKTAGAGLRPAPCNVRGDLPAP